MFEILSHLLIILIPNLILGLPAGRPPSELGIDTSSAAGARSVPLGGPTSVRVLRWVQIGGGGRLDRKLWDRNLVWHKRMAASQGHAVFAMGPDLQGERNHIAEREPEVRQLFPRVAKAPGRKTGL